MTIRFSDSTLKRKPVFGEQPAETQDERDAALLEIMARQAGISSKRKPRK